MLIKMYTKELQTIIFLVEAKDLKTKQPHQQRTDNLLRTEYKQKHTSFRGRK